MIRKKPSKHNRRESTVGSRDSPPSGPDIQAKRETVVLNILRLLVKKGMSDKDLARETGYTLRFVRGFLFADPGKLTIPEMEHIAVKLGVRFRDLLKERVF
jgi:hypothetical protein